MSCLSVLRPTWFRRIARAHEEPPPSYQPPTVVVARLAKSPANLSPERRSIEAAVDDLSSSARELSLAIHREPELAFKEVATAEKLASYMEMHGFKVTRHAYGLKTAWEATFEHGTGGRTVGFNSEMDALILGHACGHNLIAISGVLSALGVAAAMKKHDVAGKVILLGTPAEENFGGKIDLIKAGAYKPMDACLMVHPAPYEGLGEMLAIAQIDVEYTGKNAHAAGAPWEGVNALDAAVLAYSNISALRQSVPPSHRVHGVIKGSEEWVCNIIPASSKLTFGCRAPSLAEVELLKKRLEKCFEAAALATGCSIKMAWVMAYSDLRNSPSLGEEYASYQESQHGVAMNAIPSLGSTDFGNVSYELPALHPIYRIPVGPGEGNHTPGFVRAAATVEAHDATLRAAKGIAVAAWRVIESADFTAQCWREFESMKLAAA